MGIRQIPTRQFIKFLESQGCVFIRTKADYGSIKNIGVLLSIFYNENWYKQSFSILLFFLWMHKERTNESAPRSITLSSASARYTGSPPRLQPKFARSVDSPPTGPVLDNQHLGCFIKILGSYFLLKMSNFTLKIILVIPPEVPPDPRS